VKNFQKQAEQENIPAEAGIIEEVRCTNFMCHDQLTVTLGPLINFIIGENGSGKSAVLTALTLCLGGKATATNRGQSLKAFIKQGREFCVLSVKMKNQGSMAYKPEQYGDSIIAERHFNTAGASGFKLKDRNGRIVSTKKAELEDIVDAFALQLDNPMNVLTQDQARQFLNSSNPKEKYKFFLKGTQLENLNNDYKQIEHELEEQEAKAQTLLGDLGVYRKDYEKARDKAKRAGALEQLRAEEQKLRHQAIWAEVEHEERNLVELDTELDRISRLIDERQAEARTESAKFDQADQALIDANQQLHECQAEVQPAKDEVAECKARFEENTQLVMRYKV
jgi:chromosome segregation ATPase